MPFNVAREVWWTDGVVEWEYARVAMVMPCRAKGPSFACFESSSTLLQLSLSISHTAAYESFQEQLVREPMDFEQSVIDNYSAKL